MSPTNSLSTSSLIIGLSLTLTLTLSLSLSLWRLKGRHVLTDRSVINVIPILLLLRSKIEAGNTHQGGPKLVNGSSAIEHVAYALATFIFVYPATRSKYLGESSLRWS